MQDSLFIVMPAYNEAEALPDVLDEWHEVVKENPKNRLIVVNDGSTDSTGVVLTRYARENPQVIALHKQNEGHGPAVRDGYRHALSGIAGHFPDFVFQTDSDGQTSALDFPAFWESRHDHDAVIGHREQRGDGLSRLVVTKSLKAVVQACANVRLPDVNTPFRLMRTSALAQALATIPERHHLVNAELSIALARLGKRICFKPISFGKRETGVNSINLKSIARIGMRSIRDFRELNAVLP